MQKEMLDYQNFDRELRRIKRELEKNEFRVKGKELKDQRAKIEDEVARLEQRAGDLKSATARLVDLSNEVDRSMAEYEHALSEMQDEGGLNYLKKKIEEQLKELDVAERECKSVLRDCDEVSAAYEAAVKDIPRITAAYKKCNEEFSKATKEVEPTIRKIQAQQAELAKVIDQNVFDVYKKLSAQNVFPVFVTTQTHLAMKNDVLCGGCKMSISATSRSKLDEDGRVRCEHCGRIIYKS